MSKLKFHIKKSSGKLFNDRWIMTIGVLITGITFPLIFGLGSDHSEIIKLIMISVVITFLCWFITRWAGSFLWKKIPWEKNPFLHITSVLAYIFFFSGAIIGMVFLLKLIVDGRQENYWDTHRGFHLAIFIVFIFSVLVHEAIYLFFLWKRELTRSADLEKENMRSKFEALKNHVNPHFLFNSLGTLASLINTDQQKATQYVSEFSKIYRYFLEVNNNDLITLGEEIAFIESYIFLQQIRYGEGFFFSNRIDKKYFTSFILPLTLQLLIENALKHNTMSPISPLYIDVSVDEKNQTLVVQNNLQPRKTEDTPKTGLMNLEQRYLNFTGKTITIQQTDRSFIVEVPILTNEE